MHSTHRNIFSLNTFQDDKEASLSSLNSFIAIILLISRYVSKKLVSAIPAGLKCETRIIRWYRYEMWAHDPSLPPDLTEIYSMTVTCTVITLAILR